MNESYKGLINKTQFSHEDIIKVFNKEHKKIVIGYAVSFILFFIGFVVMSIFVLPFLLKNGLESNWSLSISYLILFSFMLSFIILVFQKLINKKKIIEKIKKGEYDFINSFYVLNFIAILNYNALKKIQKKYGK